MHLRPQTVPPRKAGSTRPTRATPRSPLPGNLQTRRWYPSPHRPNRSPMIRIVVFLLAIALTAAGAAWVADQTGDVTLTWGAWRVQTSLPVFALALGVAIAVGMLLWSILNGTLRAPGRIRRVRRRSR